MTNWTIRGAAAVLVAALTCVPAPSRAQEGDGGGDFLYGFNLSASLGYAIPTTDEYSNSFTFRFGAGYALTGNLTLDLGISRFKSDVDHEMTSPPPNTIADGTLKVTPVVMSLQFRRPVPQFFSTVYALAGIGYYFVDYGWDGNSKEYFQQVEELYGPAIQSVSDSFGFNLGAGFDYPVSTHLALNVEGQYIFLSPEAKGEWRDVITGEPYRFDDSIDLNTWLLTVGMRYFF